MATNYKHHITIVQLLENGDTATMYPETYAEDVNIRPNAYLPSGVTNLQQLIDRIDPVAFDSNLPNLLRCEEMDPADNPYGDFVAACTEIDDNVTESDSTWSSQKINREINDSNRLVDAILSMSESDKVRLKNFLGI